jgi:hypothetical protein
MKTLSYLMVFAKLIEHQSMSSTRDPNSQKLDVINIMEILVLEEVDDQITRRLDPQLARYIKRMEVATYALNRVPALYASSQKGVYYQVKRAKTKYREKIAEAVSRGIAAVLRDPLKNSAPLTPEVIFKVKTKLDLQEGDRDTPARELHHQTFADRRLQQEPEADESEVNPRDLAYRAAQKLRASLGAK